jgi:hypothetical protein
VPVAAPSTAAETPPAGADAGTCVEVGEFAGDGALARFHDRLAALKFNDKATDTTQESGGWYVVSVGGIKSRVEAERRAEELRKIGERDASVVQFGSASTLAVILGTYRDQEQARKHQARMERRGAKGLKIEVDSLSTTSVRVKGIDNAAAAQLEALQKEFPQQKQRGCG